MNESHELDRATRLVPVAAGCYEGQSADAYWNFAGPFGGVTAATLLRAVLEHADCRGEPVALSVNFCGLIRSGGYQVRAELLRGGRTTQHWSVVLTQADAVLASASVIFANRPDTWAHQPAEMPIVPPPESVAPMTDGRVRWMSNYEFRFVEGAMKLSRTHHDPLRSPRSVVWLQDRPARALDWISLAALSDAFFPRVLHARGTAAPMGTVTLTTYFHANAAEMSAQGSAPVLGVADGLRFTRSFQDQRIELWSHEGILLASGMQVLWYAQ